MSTNDICSSALSSLPSQKWLPINQWQNPDFCVNSVHASDRDRPAYAVTTLKAKNSSDMYLELRAYPKTAEYTFMPVNQYAEFDIIQAAKKHGESFYYIHIRYEGPYDKINYPCNESGAECECIYSTYYKSTYKELKMHTNIKPRSP